MESYRVVVLGEGAPALPPVIEQEILRSAADFGVKKNQEVVIGPPDYAPGISTVALFLGGSPAPPFKDEWLLRLGVPIVPIVSHISKATKELPPQLHHLNAMPLNGLASAGAIASVAMECLGLLPRQRRVFVSYVRKETSNIALQLFSELSSRQFQVFIDTHDIRPGDEFQATLWHKLCDSDVMIMLDSKSYFDRRWTREEYGRASVKKAALLRVRMPGVRDIDSLSVTDEVLLAKADMTSRGRLKSDVLDGIADRIEGLRSGSIAVRHANLVGTIGTVLKEIKGRLLAAGSLRSLEIELPRGRRVLTYTAIGVPTAEVLNQIADHAKARDAAIVYDQLGIHERWVKHRSWLSDHVPEVRWIPAHEAGWVLRGWDAE